MTHIQSDKINKINKIPPTIIRISYHTSNFVSLVASGSVSVIVVVVFVVVVFVTLTGEGGGGGM